VKRKTSSSTRGRVGLPTFFGCADVHAATAHSARADELDIAVIGIPFDGGTAYRRGDTIEISVRLYHFIELAAGSAQCKLNMTDRRRAVVFYEE